MVHCGLTPLRAKTLPFQNALLLVRAQLNPVVHSKNPPALPGALPVAVEKPITRLAGMTLAGPLHEPLLHQIIVPAQGCCRDNAVVVGYPSHNQWIELLNDPRLRSCLQLLQALIDGSKVSLARFLAGDNDGLHPRRGFLWSKLAHERSDDGLASR